MNVRFSILLVLVLLLVGGGVAISRELSTTKGEPKNPWLFKVDIDEIVGISVVYQGQQMSYERQDDQWVIKDGNDTPVFQDKWAGTTLLLSGPRVSRAVADEIGDASTYGLDPPAARVQLANTSGFPLEFHLGDPTPDEDDWYARLVGSQQLFTVPASWGTVVTRLAIQPPYEPTPTPTRPPSEDDAPDEEGVTEGSPSPPPGTRPAPEPARPRYIAGA